MRNRGLLLIALILLLCSNVYSYEEIPLQNTPTSIAVNHFDNTAYAISENSKILYKVDLISLSILSSYTFQDKPRDVAISSDRVYVPLGKDANGFLTVFDKNLNLISTINIGKSPSSVATGNGYVAVACENDNTLYVISEGSLILSYSLNIGMKPNHIEIDEKRNEITVSAAMAADPGKGTTTGGKLFFIDLPTGNIKRTIDTVQKIKGLKINTLTDRIVLTNAVNGIDIMNPDTMTIESHVDLPGAGAADINQSTGMMVVLSPLTLNILSIDDGLISYFLTKGLNDASINPYTNKAAVATGDSIILFQLPNPIPEITKLIPESAKVGDSGFILRIEGKYFITTSSVQFNQNNLATTFINNDSLEASVPSTLLTTAGIIPVTVTNPPPGGGTSQPYDFTIKNPAPILSGLTPATIAASAPDFTLKAIGANFSSGCVINLNGNDLATTYISSTELNGIVPSSLIATKGSYPVVVKTPDMQSSNVLNLTVIEAPPSITDFMPKEGVPGAVVTITGENLNYGPKVSFAGVQATAISPLSTEVKAVVPMGAKTGIIKVITSGGSAESAEPFTVLTRHDFRLNVNPSSVSIPQNGNASFVVNLTSTGIEQYTGLVKLSINNIPSGITAAFNPEYISSNQSSVLTVSLTSALTSQTGLTIDGTCIIDGVEVTRIVNVVLNPVPAGTTSLSGQVLATKDAKPIKGVTLKIGTATTATDDAGNFIFIDPPTGEQVVIVDGDTANTETVSYPSMIAVPVNIVGGQNNILPYSIYIHEVNTDHFTIIDPTKDTSVTDPSIPDYQMTIPAGTVIMGYDGNPNEKISVTPLPVDRIAIKPPPEGVYARTIFMYYFFKPGGGIPNRPVPVIMPNEAGALPGTRVTLWYYDESYTPDVESNQWKVFGMGTVSPDGKTIVPDPGVGIPKFCCGASFPAPPPPPPPPPPPDCTSDCCGMGGDPVYFGSGIFIINNAELSIPGRIPITIERTYRTLDNNIGPFGRGSSFNWGDTIYVMPGNNQAVTMVTKGSAQYIFSRNPDGTYSNTRFPFLSGTKITSNPDGTLTEYRKDGSIRKYRIYTVTMGRLYQIIDRNGSIINFDLDGAGTPVRITDSNGRGFTITWNGNLITSITDHTGKRVTYTYDANSNLISVTNAEGGITRYTYDVVNRLTSVTNPRGITEVTNEYDTNGRVIRQTHADGGIFTLEYFVAGGQVAVAKITDPLGNTKSYRFRNNYVMSITNQYGQTTYYDRDYATNNLMSVTDPLGRVTRYTYDQNGNTTSIVDPAGNTTIIEYDQTYNKPVKMTNSLGNVTSMAYDSKGNLISITDPLGNTTTALTYNKIGKPITITDAMGNVTTLEYDAYGNLVKSIDPLGDAATMNYDDLGRLTETIDPRGRSSQYTYDIMSRITQIIDALNGTTKFTYDLNGNLLSSTDAKGHGTAYTYDIKNKVALKTDQFGRTERYTYDQNGNLISAIDRKGQVIDYSYDSLNRITKASYADGSYTSYIYDAVGRLTNIDDSISGPMQYVYSNVGCGACGGRGVDKIIEEITQFGSISYEYNAIGRRTKMQVAGQPAVNYNYDGNGRLVGISTQINGSDANFIRVYNALGRRISMTLPNGTTTNYAYDNAYRLTDLKYLNPLSAILESIIYTYDASGNRTSMSRQTMNSTLPNQVSNTSYNEANQMLTFNDKNITYDANGNMTSVTNSCGTTNYSWDVRNRLIGITGFKADCSVLTASFKYDALGRRMEKTIDGRTIQYLYDGMDIVQEIENGQVMVNYIRTMNIDEPLVRSEASGTVRYYQRDALGSVIALTDETGTVKTTYSYDPFGNAAISGEASDNRFQYTGRENDGTGLYYYRARYYSPELHRFISEDPIGLSSGQVNYYVYVKNNPMINIDPTGLACLKIWSSVTGSLTEITIIGWELRDKHEDVLHNNLTVSCTWDKHERGWITKYIVDYYICVDCDKCTCNVYSKTENRTEFDKLDEIIATFTNFARLTYPVYGGYGLGFWQCFEPE